MLACSAMVACTNTDEPENKIEGQEANTAYVSVKLVMTSESGSRATTDGGYAVGSKEEQTISSDKSIFLFYDKDGKWVTDGKVLAQDPSTNNSATDHKDQINDISAASYIVLSGPDSELKKSTQILTVVNYDNVNSLKQLNLNEALAIITDSQKNKPNAGFLMTTSVYYNEGVVQTTKINGEENICDTQEEAMSNPVKIYIERASAKVEATFNPTYEVLGDGEKPEKEDMVVDGSKVEAQIKINGWKLNAVNEETYLVKQIDPTWGESVPFEGWNFSGNFRSYWAKSTNWDMTYTGAENDLTYYTYNQATGTTATPEYCYEQTVASQLEGVGEEEIIYPNQTTILIAAEIQLKGENGFATAGNLYKYGGVFYTEKNYKNLIMKQLKGIFYTKTTTTTADLTGQDITLDIVSNETLAGIKFDVKLAKGVSVWIKNATTNMEKPADATDIANYINSLGYVTEVEGYKDGKCYYHIPIEHLSSGETPFYGVVRNHWYKLNISAVKHIGSAIYNPEKEIVVIPAEDTTFYLAAELHVLSWHVVQQNVELK